MHLSVCQALLLLVSYAFRRTLVNNRLWIISVSIYTLSNFIKIISFAVISNTCVKFLFIQGDITHKSTSLMIIGVIALIASFLTLLLPETFGRKLPDTIQDVEDHAAGNKCRDGRRDREGHDPTGWHVINLLQISTCFGLLMSFCCYVINNLSKLVFIDD